MLENPIFSWEEDVWRIRYLGFAREYAQWLRREWPFTSYDDALEEHTADQSWQAFFEANAAPKPDMEVFQQGLSLWEQSGGASRALRRLMEERRKGAAQVRGPHGRTA